MRNNIPYPGKISFVKWAAEIVRLYYKENIPIIKNEKDWRPWANNLINKPSFKKNNVPAVSNKTKEIDFDNNDRLKWQKTLYSIMINTKK